MTAKTTALRILLAAIIVSGVLGIVGILGKRFDDTGVKCLVTALMIGTGCLVSLACFAAWEKPGAKFVSRIGAAGTIVAVLLGTTALWADNDHKWLMKLIAAATIVGVAGAHASTLWLTRLPMRTQGLRSAALATSVLLVTVLFGTLWSEPRSDGVYQIIAILSIIAAGLTVAIAAVSAVARTGGTPGVASNDVCFCPRCGKSLWEQAGEIRCRHCGDLFFIELRKSEELPDAILKR